MKASACRGRKASATTTTPGARRCRSAIARDDGGMAVFYTFSDRGDLLGRDRPETLADQRARGGRNFGNFNCGPTSFQPAGQSADIPVPVLDRHVERTDRRAVRAERSHRDDPAGAAALVHGEARPAGRRAAVAHRRCGVLRSRSESARQHRQHRRDRVRSGQRPRRPDQSVLRHTDRLDRDQRHCALRGR